MTRRQKSGLSSNFGGYRFGFNGKEKDTNKEWGELTHYDYGARIYNPAIARFLSVDPLARTNASQSPYSYANNSPVTFVDVNGGDGIIYLVILPEARGIVNPELIASHANEIASQIGLNIHVKVFDHGGVDDINQEFLDATDNYVVIGKTSFDVNEYFKRNALPEHALSEFFIKNRTLVENAHRQRSFSRKDGLVLAEASSLLQAAGLSVTIAQGAVDNEVQEAQEQRVAGEDIQRAPSLEEYIGLAVLHEVGHNITGIRHGNGDDVGFMKAGLFYSQEGIDDVINSDSNQKIVPKFNAQMLDIKLNLDIIEFLEKGLIEQDYRTPKDNYLENKTNENDG